MADGRLAERCVSQASDLDARRSGLRARISNRRVIVSSVGRQHSDAMASPNEAIGKVAHVLTNSCWIGRKSLRQQEDGMRFRNSMR